MDTVIETANLCTTSVEQTLCRRHRLLNTLCYSIPL